MMTDAEVADQIDRADRFIADFREMVATTAVDPASQCADAQRSGLQRIAATPGFGTGVCAKQPIRNLSQGGCGVAASAFVAVAPSTARSLE